MGTIERLLIANRGEIAVRIAVAARELGIEVVGVVGPGDEGAAHLESADAVARVPSYLDRDAIVRGAGESRADAVHPGYGFLAEDPGFAEAVLDAGLTWVGPPPEAMRRLADKLAARALAAEVGVPVAKGSTETEASSDEALVDSAIDVGFPLMVKAAAGGGGRGMRRVEAVGALADAIVEARAEAAAAFGDDRLFVERIVEGARHVEIQIVLDAAGAGVHLGERDCTLQRRHQKVLEESPSPAVTPALRDELGDAALRIAAGVGYEGVGTAEFLLRADGTWSFLEMNARLQVEHPVTEAVTGIDLVQTQLRIAGGEPLGLRQGDGTIRGHAIEARVYAEDPAAGFWPAIGKVDLLEFPRRAGIRIDTALREGDRVGLGYDPLLAKVIAVAPDRTACMTRLRLALQEVRIVGLPTNLGFLIDVLAQPDVVDGRIDTTWVERVWRPDVPDLPTGVTPDPDPRDPWAAFGASVAVPGVTVAGRHALYRGWSYEIRPDELEPVGLAPPDGALTAPMSATVLRIDVVEGETVAAGQAMMVLEAMKMHMTIDAVTEGVVDAVHVSVGDVVSTGQRLVDMVEP
jgi:acetyl/propionyl-CoA carboxylase alpha subunit